MAALASLDSVPDEFLLALGRCTAAGAQLELRFTLLAGAALGMGQRSGAFLFGRETASKRLDVARKTVDAFEPTESRDVTLDWLSRAQAVWQRRNRHVHQPIAVNGEVISQAIFGKRLNEPKFTFECVTADDLEGLARDLTGLTEEFDSTVIEGLIQQHPWTRAMFGHEPGTSAPT